MSLLDIINTNVSEIILNHLGIEDRKSIRLVRSDFDGDVCASVTSMECSSEEEMQFSLRCPSLKNVTLDNAFVDELSLHSYMTSVRTRRIEELTYIDPNFGKRSSIQIPELPPSVKTLRLVAEYNEIAITPSATLKRLAICDYGLRRWNQPCLEGFTGLDDFTFYVGSFYQFGDVGKSVLDLSHTSLKTIRIDAECELILPATADTVHIYDAIITNKTFESNPPLRTLAMPPSYEEPQDTRCIWRYMENFAITISRISSVVPPHGVHIAREPGIPGMSFFILPPFTVEGQWQHADEGDHDAIRSLATIASFVDTVYVCCETIDPVMKGFFIGAISASLPFAKVEFKYGIESLSDLDPFA